MAFGGRIWKRVTFFTGLLTSTFSKWVYWGNLSDRTVMQLLCLSAWIKHLCCINMLILNYFTISKEFLEAIFPRLDSSTRTITNEKMEWSQYLSSYIDPCSVGSSHSQVVWLLCCCYVSTSFCHFRHQCLLCPLCCIFLPNIGGSFLFVTRWDFSNKYQNLLQKISHFSHPFKSWLLSPSMRALSANPRLEILV
jgi:hypothetical protein